MARILLVDDDGSFREMLRLTLVKMGHEVTDAGNGREAMRLCEENPPELLLTDLIMPEREGLETIQAVRRSHPNVKIVAMSGGARINARDFLKIARLMGAQEVLEKPFSNLQLQGAIEAALASAGEPGAQGSKP